MNSFAKYIALGAIIVSAFCSAVPAQAEFHRFMWYPPLNVGNQVAGRASYFDILFNKDDNNFKFYVVIEKKNGVLPNAFQIAVNSGPNPRLKAGELAFFYFDASNPTDIKLTVYGHNGINMEDWQDGSEQVGIQPPDKIFSTEAPAGGPQNPAGWIKELAYLNDGDKAIFLMNIDATLINSHVPLYPGAPGEDWTGIQFGSKLGMWFHPIVDVTSAYGADGFLSAWSRRIVGWYDTANQTTGMAGPLCEGKIKAGAPPVPLKIGQNFFTSVIGEAYGQILNPDIFTITYSGVPSNAVFSVPAGVPQLLPVGAGIETEFNWVPGPQHAGQQFDINVTFTTQDNLSVSCPFSLIVEENIPPVCDSGASAGAYQNLSCTSATTSVNLDGSASNDPDNTAAAGGSFTFKWTSDCPGASFNDATLSAPTLTFSSENSDSTPVSCNAFLEVSDGFKSASCQAAVSVAPCLKDCNSVINGSATFDICGICQGNGTSCLDCAGTAFGTASLDRCNVCNGDGQSCLNCAEADITDSQLMLDNNSAQQEKVIKQALRSYKRIAKGRKASTYARKTAEQADSLQQAAWTSIWSVPSVSTQCSNSAFCKSGTDYVNEILSFNENSLQLKLLAEDAIARLEKAQGGKTRKSKKLLSQAEALHNENIATTTSLPAGSSECN